ncbi:MAG: multicopper oxidase domain-containing protein [Thaumarchaeota archaeon]|nr:multicopper oxidase domain-containing protein [Nitrososphaerota archaeon]
MNDRGALALVIMGLLIGAFSLGVYVGNPDVFNGTLPAPREVRAQEVKHYTLVVQSAEIEVAPDAVWHAWTFNGTVPGPTIHLTIGDRLDVRVINQLDLTHSFHTHLLNYNFSSDGSQANVIAGLMGPMIPAGEDFTYRFTATKAGIYYYHCHSSDQFPIAYHIHQGLYGAIIVDDVNAPKLDHDWVVFMGEAGRQISGAGASKAPPFIMNGLGIPGGEAALMDLHASKGFDGVAAQLNKSLPAFQMKLGETARISIVNIGDQVHSFHLHNLPMISQWYFPGRDWPGNVIQLVPGAADSVFVTATQPGVWLFHCHVVFHADAGMIGAIIVSK